jgi:hypothetical protein
MPRNTGRTVRRKRVVRTVPRKNIPSASGRDSHGRGFDNLAKRLREEVSADGGNSRR